METAQYMAQRLLYTVCNVMCPIDKEKEPIYAHLMHILDQMTSLGSRQIKLPKLKYDLDDIIKDMCKIYKSIFDAYEDKESLQLIECLFVATHHMMARHTHNTTICSRLAYCFVAIVKTMDSWTEYVTKHQ